jgi:hypothetical protein
MSEIRIGDLVGLESTPRWGMRVKVVLEVDKGDVTVVDQNGIVYKADAERLNLTMPGFVESPLSPAMEKWLGLGE